MEGLCFINKLQMQGVWCLDIPDHSQSHLTLNILKQMECQNRKVSSNDKQKTNGNDHQLTFAGQNAFHPNAITNFAIHSMHWKIRRLPFSHQMSSTSLKTFTVPSTSLDDLQEPKKDPNIFLPPYQITCRKMWCFFNSQIYVIRKQPQHDQAQIDI